MTQQDSPAIPPRLPEKRDPGKPGADVAPTSRAGVPIGGDAKRQPVGSWWRSVWRWDRFRRRETASFVASVVFHTTLLVALALIIEAGRSFSPFTGLTMTPSQSTTLDTIEPIVPRLDESPSWDRVEGQSLAIAHEPTEPRLEPTMESPSESSSTARLDPLGLDPDKLLQKVDVLAGALEGRRPGRRAQLAAERGGTPESEAAVERGLRWLAAQQHKDGSWTFYHPRDMTRRPYRDPGTETSTTAATAMALLPFLGAGHTHLAGEYQDAVGRGLYYLNNRTHMTPQGADLREGTMYAQGLAAIVLCEAYGLTRDETLKGLAARAIDFIVHAQDKNGGGWRYTPGEPGDTTVTGWQLMALKSAEMAGLHVPSTSPALAGRFLDSVASDYGAKYGYLTPDPRQTTTAIGLLCRMYLGWEREEEALVRGVGYLDRWGPSKNDMYFNYYATQVLCHFDGPLWEKWNAALRDYLIRTQATEGLEAGSWFFVDEKCASGGRLYNTAMAVMTLEVYYRYMPLYKPDVMRGRR